jgi:hypothetical protein
MTQSSKIKLPLLLLAALVTVLALTPPPPAQACPAYDIEQCYYPNGVSCRAPECPKHPTTCNGIPSGTPTCYYAGVECCL